MGSSNISGAILIPEKLRKAAKRSKLTPREVQVLALFLTGHTWKLAAFSMEISESGIRFHMQKIFKKVGAHSTPEALGKLLT